MRTTLQSSIHLSVVGNGRYLSDLSYTATSYFGFLRFFSTILRRSDNMRTFNASELYRICK